MKYGFAVIGVLAALLVGGLLWRLSGGQSNALPVYPNAQPATVTAAGARITRSPNPGSIGADAHIYSTDASARTVYNWYRQTLAGSDWAFAREAQTKCFEPSGVVIYSALFDWPHPPWAQDWEKLVVAVAANSTAWTDAPAAATNVVLVHYRTRTWGIAWFDSLGAYWNGVPCNGN